MRVPTIAILLARLMPFDLDAYLARLGYGGATDATPATLAAIHEAHAAVIPFENVDVLLGRPLDLTPEGVVAKLVAARRGGYCYEHALLLHAAFTALGFPVSLLAARVRMGYAGPRPRTHALLLAEAGGERWVADAGFGLRGLLEPLPLREGAEADLPLASFRLAREGAEWVMRSRLAGGDWEDLYLFSTEPQQPVDYVMANHFTATWPQSPFIRSLVVARVRRASRALLIDRTLSVTTSAGTESREVAGPPDLYRTLTETFGLDVAAEAGLAAKVFA